VTAEYLKDTASAWAATAALGHAILGTVGHIYGRLKAMQEEHIMYTGKLETKTSDGTEFADLTCLLTIYEPSGTLQLTLAQWAERPDVWLRGLDLPIILWRANAHIDRRKSGSEAPGAPFVNAYDIVMLPDEKTVAERVAALHMPPKGRRGALARKMRKALLEDLKHAPGRQQEAINEARRGLRQRDALRDSLLKVQADLLYAQNRIKEQAATIEQLEARVEPLAGLEILFRWWEAESRVPMDAFCDDSKLRKVRSRVFHALAAMFPESPVPK
jgi:hypothetical protein